MRQALFVTLFIAVAFVANAADIEDGLWMYLPLNEGTGQTVADHGPNEFETELSKDAPKWVDAKHDSIKNAMEFDGKSHYVKIDMEAQKKDIDSHFDERILIRILTIRRASRFAPGSKC